MGFSDSLGKLGGAVGGEIGTEDGDSRYEKSRILDILSQMSNRSDSLDSWLFDNREGLKNSAFEKISTDPRTRQAEMEALSRLQGVSRAGGFDAQARATNAEGQREAAGYEQAQSQALQQGLQARGMGNSGADIAGLMSAQQGGANRAGMSALQASAEANRRQMDATKSTGALGGAVRGQDFSEAAAKAQAMDDMAQRRFQDKLQVMGQQRLDNQGLNNYYAASRAERIGNNEAMGTGTGSTIGSVADASTGGGAMGGGGGGGGGNAKAPAAGGAAGYSSSLAASNNGVAGQNYNNAMASNQYGGTQGNNYVDWEKMFGGWGQ